MAAFIDIDGCIINLDHVVRVTVSRKGNDCTTTVHLTDHTLNSREDVFPGDLREAFKALVPCAKLERENG
jgi:hypothetical protein